MRNQFDLTCWANLSNITNCRLSKAKEAFISQKRKKIKVHKVINFILSSANICQHLKRAGSKRTQVLVQVKPLY